MAKTIQQTVKFAGKPNKAFALYMDSKQHSAVTGHPAKVAKKAPGSFSAFGGGIKGKLLHVVKNKQIVQTWRDTRWKKDVGDSVLTLTFSPGAKGGTDLQMVHANLPDSALASVKKGWNDMYWDKWKAAMAPKPKAAPKKKAAPKRKTAKPAAKRSASRTTAGKAAGKKPARRSASKRK